MLSHSQGRSPSPHRRGELFQVELRSAMPERGDVVVDRHHDDAPDRERAMVAIRETFDAASRQIEDIARDMRGQVKEHTAESLDSRPR